MSVQMNFTLDQIQTKPKKEGEGNFINRKI